MVRRMSSAISAIKTISRWNLPIVFLQDFLQTLKVVWPGDSDSNVLSLSLSYTHFLQSRRVLKILFTASVEMQSLLFD